MTVKLRLVRILDICKSLNKINRELDRKFQNDQILNQKEVINGLRWLIKIYCCYKQIVR